MPTMKHKRTGDVRVVSDKLVGMLERDGYEQVKDAPKAAAKDAPKG